MRENRSRLGRTLEKSVLGRWKRQNRGEPQRQRRHHAISILERAEPSVFFCFLQNVDIQVLGSALPWDRV